jgi:hypothetical protein
MHPDEVFRNEDFVMCLAGSKEFEDSASVNQTF